MCHQWAISARTITRRRSQLVGVFSGLSRMRLTYLLLVIPLSLNSGCSVLIARSGKDLHNLATREQVHASLGEPAAAGIENGQPFEEYHTRRKISETDTLRVYALGMGIIYSYGVYELIAFPKELYLLGSRTLRGQTICVTYDGNGNVSGFYLDREPLISFPSRQSTANDLQDAVPLPASPEATPPSPAPPSAN